MLQLFIILYIILISANVCTHEHSAGGNRGGKVCKLLLKPVNKDGCDATGDKIEINVRIMDSVHY